MSQKRHPKTVEFCKRQGCEKVWAYDMRPNMPEQYVLAQLNQQGAHVYVSGESQIFVFCSETCRDEYLKAHPDVHIAP